MNKISLLGYFVFHSVLFPRTIGNTHFKTVSTSWTMDSPSHSPMQPPRSDKNLAKINLRKLVVVTIIVGEKVRLIVELLWVLMVSAKSLVSTEVVVQGSGQSDSCVPSSRSS